MVKKDVTARRLWQVVAKKAALVVEWADVLLRKLEDEDRVPLFVVRMEKQNDSS